MGRPDLLETLELHHMVEYHFLHFFVEVGRAVKKTFFLFDTVLDVSESFTNLDLQYWVAYVLATVGANGVGLSMAEALFFLSLMHGFKCLTQLWSQQFPLARLTLFLQYQLNLIKEYILVLTRLERPAPEFIHPLKPLIIMNIGVQYLQVLLFLPGVILVQY